VHRCGILGLPRAKSLVTETEKSQLNAGQASHSPPKVPPPAQLSFSRCIIASAANRLFVNRLSRAVVPIAELFAQALTAYVVLARSADININAAGEELDIYFRRLLPTLFLLSPTVLWST